MTPRASIAAVTAACLWLAPRAAAACAVCSTGRTDETRIAFIVTTGFMTFLPLLLIGGVFWWLRRRFRQMEGASQRTRASAPRDDRAATHA